VIDCSSGGLFGSATAARGKRARGFRVPFAERVRREAGEDILQQGRADPIAIGRAALVNPCWPQMAQIALGHKPVEAMDDWPVEYGWWLKHPAWAIERMRVHSVANSGEN
jgi:2,4-dienoyl-CoA reductase-like NADH-dependent reductase (Old Yellow Enzyme family)